MKREIKDSKKIFFIIFYITIIILGVIIFRQYVNEQIKKQLMSSMSDIATQNLTLIKTKIDSRWNELNSLSIELSKKENYDYKNYQADMEQFAHIFGFREIGVALSDGIAYMSTNTIYDISDREYFKHSMQGENYISEILTDMRDYADINVYSVPLKDQEGKIKGVFFGIDDTSRFLEVFKTSIFDNRGYTYLINSDGDVIPGSFNQNFEMKNLFTNLKKFPRNEKAIDSLTSILKKGESESLLINNNGYRYITLNPTEVNDCWLVTAVPESVLKERVAIITNVMQLIIGCIFLGSCILLFILINVQNKYEKYLKKIAYTDKLTGIYNREYLQASLFRNIKAIQGKKAALVTYDINRFKIINEIYGENIGNKILKQIAQILKDNLVFDKEFVIRDHADEFYGLYFYKTRDELEKRITDIIQKTEIIEFDGNHIKIKMAIGIYEINNIEYSFEKICSYAKIAKNNNKKSTDDLFEYYSDDLKKKELEQKQLNDAIREGIQKKEFKAWFQPKFDAKTGKVVGAEALARWCKKDGTVLSPYHFIEFSEKSGLIQDIDRMIFEDVCMQISNWQRQGIPCVPISVNLSRAYLNNVNSIYYLKAILEKYQVSGEYIQLEVTESAIVDSEEELSHIIDIMHNLGFRVLLDDFGVGYSSLISINNLKFDVLKIDKSFIDSIGTEKGENIVKYTISLAKNLGMEIIAEGVEVKEQYEFLKKHKCDVIQGYYFSKPLSTEEFSDRLKNQCC